MDQKTSASAVSAVSTSVSVAAAKPSRMQILQAIYKAISAQLAQKFEYDTTQSSLAMEKALDLYAIDAQKGLDAAQAVVDRGNGLLIKEWTEEVQDAINRARAQLAQAETNKVSEAILSACGETLDDVEFSFAPISEGERALKAADRIRELQRSLEKVDKVGLALKGENDRFADANRVAEAAALKVALKNEGIIVPEGAVDEIYFPKPQGRRATQNFKKGAQQAKNHSGRR